MHYDFTEDWHGWRLRGNFLVSPDRQHITRERLEGLLWRDAQELRLAGLRSRREAMKPRQVVRVLVVELADHTKSDPLGMEQRSTRGGTGRADPDPTIPAYLGRTDRRTR